MKGKAVICIIAVFLALVLTSIGCGLTTEGGAVSMMKKMPKDSGRFYFTDLDAMRTDTDLEKDTDLESFLTYLGIDFINSDEVDRFAYGAAFNILFEGDFDLDRVRMQLEERDRDGDEYRGIEVWGAEGWMVALVSNKLIILGSEADVKDCITVIKDGDASLYDDEDFRAVMERLPSGIVVKCEVGVSPLTYESYEGLDVVGISAMKKDKHNMAFTMIFKFENRDAASDAMDEIEYDLENENRADWRNIDVTQDAQLVIATTEQNIEDWSPWGSATESEAAQTELANVQSAVVAMMVDSGISELPNPVTVATNDMSAFPDAKGTYVLRGLVWGDETVNYIHTDETKGTYTVDIYGTVNQVTTGYE